MALDLIVNGGSGLECLTRINAAITAIDALGTPTTAGIDMLTAADAIAQAALIGSNGGNGSADAGLAATYNSVGELTATESVAARVPNYNDFEAGLADGLAACILSSFNGISFERYVGGALFSGLITPASLSAGRTWTLPDASGALLVTGDIGVSVQAYSSALVTLAAKSLSGSGNLACVTSPSFTTPILGTPTSGTLTNCTGLPIASGVSGLGSGIAAALALAANNAAGGIPLNAASKWTLGNYGDITTSNDTGLYLGTGSTRMMYLSYINGTIQVLAASLGFSGNTSANNHDLIVGRAAAATMQLGVNHATTATKQTIKAHNVTTGTGATLCIAGGTGSSAGGAVEIATSATTGAPTVRMIVKADGNINMTLPTSSAGLSSGDLWSNSGVVTVA